MRPAVSRSAARGAAPLPSNCIPNSPRSARLSPSANDVVYILSVKQSANAGSPLSPESCEIRPQLVKAALVLVGLADFENLALRKRLADNLDAERQSVMQPRRQCQRGKTEVIHRASEVGWHGGGFEI